MLNLPSRCVGVAVAHSSPNAVELWMRNHTPPIIGRIEDNQFIMDTRTLQEEELGIIARAFADMLADDHQKR